MCFSRDFCGFFMAWSKHFDASGDVNHVESGYDEEEKEKNVHAHNHDCGDIIGIIAKQFRREKSRNGKRKGKQNHRHVFLVVDKRADFFFEDYQI